MRPGKDAKYMNVYIERSVVDMLDEFCHKTGSSKSGVTQCAIADYVTRSAKSLGIRLDTGKNNIVKKKGNSVKKGGAENAGPAGKEP